MAMAPSEINATPSRSLRGISPTPLPTAPTAPSQTSAPRPNLRNPLPLSAAQEAQVRDIYYKKVRSNCADEIKEFALCAKGRTFSTSWTCRAQRFAMNSCMITHATPENEDAAREEWFASVQERRRQREEDLEKVELRRGEVIDMTRRQEEKERLLKEEEDRKKGLLDNKTTTKKGWWG